MQEYSAGTVRYGAGTVRLCRCTVVQEYGVAVGLESEFRLFQQHLPTTSVAAHNAAKHAAVSTALGATRDLVGRCLRWLLLSTISALQPQTPYDALLS